MKNITLLFYISFILVFSCCRPYKSYDVDQGVVNQYINTAGAYTFRLCEEPDIFEGVEVIVFKKCSGTDTTTWNQLTCFVFIDEKRVEYHSLSPDKNSKTILKNKFRNPAMAGWYESDTTNNRITMHMHKGKWKDRRMGKLAPITLELTVEPNENAFYIQAIKTVRTDFIKVYKPDSVFGKNNKLEYGFERFQASDER